MEVVNCCIKPPVQITLGQNICFRHALEKMTQHNQYTSNNFHIINPFFSCSYHCPFTHHSFSIFRTTLASTFSY